MNFPRIPIAEAGAASAGKDIGPRTAWFWFFYNWDTRQKLVLENHDSRVAEVIKNDEWERLYKVTVHLPIPTVLDQREVIELTEGPAYTIKGDSFIPGRSVAYQLGRRLFFRVGTAVPDISPSNPLETHWESGPWRVDEDLTHYPSIARFTVKTLARRFRVTIEEIDNDPPWIKSAADFTWEPHEDQEQFVRDCLAEMRQRPLIYTASRSTFVVTVATMLGFLGVSGPVEKHLHIKEEGGNQLVQGGKMVDTDFAERVIDEALRILDEVER